MMVMLDRLQECVRSNSKIINLESHFQTNPCKPNQQMGKE